MKKKVCIIHKVQSLDARSYYKECRSLEKAGYDTTFMCFIINKKEVDEIKIVGFKPPKRRLVRFLVTNYRIFKEALKEKADIYHFHDLDFVPWAVLLKIVTKAKIIYDIHEAHPEYMMIKTYLPIITRRFLSISVYIMEHTAIKFFDAIIPNDNFIAKGFRHNNNVVIFNFPTLDFFKGDNGTPWESRKYDLFYHGSLPKYHFKAMMSIAEKLNSENVKNVWGIVTNDKSFIVWAKKEIQIKGLDNNFDFLPYTDYLNVYKYLAMAKIGIIPLPPYKKFMKNIPLKMFEFMGCGMPVVLSDLPPSRQFILNENCAIAVEPNNIDEYVQAIKRLLRDPEKSIEMGKNGQKLVYGKYNWGVEEKKLLALYESLI